jgi:hypothetical protein
LRLVDDEYATCETQKSDAKISQQFHNLFEVSKTMKGALDETNISTSRRVNYLRHYQDKMVLERLIKITPHHNQAVLGEKKGFKEPKNSTFSSDPTTLIALQMKLQQLILKNWLN